MALGLVLAGVWLHGQTAGQPRFEVASVKPAAGRFGQRGGPGTSDPGQIVYNGVDLQSLIYRAYRVRANQLSAPAWLAEEHYDIVAKVPAGTTPDELRLMFQNLLAERFRLKVHHESRVMEAYALTMGKNGPIMTAYPTALPEGSQDGVMPRPTGIDKDGFFLFPPGSVAGMMGSSDGQTRINLAREPVTELCNFLSRLVRAPVLDRTGLPGRYDVRLRFASEPSGAPEPDDADSPSSVPKAFDPAPVLYRALENQLGLKLERKRLAVDFLVVDSAAKRPTEN